MIKRWISGLLALVLAVTATWMPANANDLPEEEPLLNVQLDIYSRLHSFGTLDGLYRDNTLYASPSDICYLLGCWETAPRNENAVAFCVNNGMRVVEVCSNGSAYEYVNDYVYSFSVPAVEYSGEIYVSLPHLFRYLGVGVAFGADENAAVHMSVNNPYTILDAWGEYGDGRAFAFSWAEADGKMVDPIYLKELCGIQTLLLGYDANLFSYVISPSAVEKDVYKDVLAELVLAEGCEYIGSQDKNTALFAGEQLNDIWGITLTTVDIVTYLLSGSSSLSADVIGAVYNYSQGYTGEALAQLEAMNQYNNMTSAQVALLDGTLNRIRSGSEIYKSSKDLIEASKEVSVQVRKDYAAADYNNARSVLDMIVQLTSTGFSVYAQEPMLAWNALMLVLTHNSIVGSLVEKGNHVTFATICAKIQAIGRALQRSSASDLVCNDLYISAPSTVMQEQLKLDMILTLKSSILARQHLLETGRMKDESAANMEQNIAYTAEVLNKIVNAQPVLLGIAPVVGEDLTWIANLAETKSGWGDVVTIDDNTYYWRYNNDCFTLATLEGTFSQTMNAREFICLDADGKETVLFNAVGGGDIAVVNNRIFYYRSAPSETGLYCCTLEGKNHIFLGGGSITNVLDSGNYLIAGGSTVVNTKTLETFRLNPGTGYRYLGYHDGFLYYQTPVADQDAAAMGEIAISAIAIDGSGEKEVFRSEPNLYASPSDQRNPAKIDCTVFADDCLYFLYGSWYNSTTNGLQFYEGGRVIRMEYDGSASQVVSGSELAPYTSFSVNENGSINPYDKEYDSSTIFFSGDTGYILNPESGEKITVITPEDYAGVGPGKVGNSYTDYIVNIIIRQKVDNKVYYLAHCRQRESDMGWRSIYILTKSVFFVKDLETGEVTELYSF